MATKGKSSERLQMTGTVHKAYKVLLKLINPKFTSKDKGIPLEVIKNAKGLAFVTQIKAGFVFTGTVGAGIIIARLADGSWSGPTSVGVGGMGWGLQIGGSVTDSVIILNTPAAVKAFSGKGQVKLGGNISIAAGPLGRDADGAVNVGDGGVAACYSYSHSRGAFAGLSLQGAVLFARDSDNSRFYGEKVTPTAILSGIVKPPEPLNEDLRLLYGALRVVTHSETSNYEFRDSRTGSLRREFEAAGLEAPSQSQSQPAAGGRLDADFGTGAGAASAQSPTRASTTAAQYGGDYGGGYGGDYGDDAASLGPALGAPAAGGWGVPVAAPAPAALAVEVASLPAGWTELTADDGKQYYWHAAENKTQWDRPAAAAAAAAPPPPPPPPPAPAPAPLPYAMPAKSFASIPAATPVPAPVPSRPSLGAVPTIVPTLPPGLGVGLGSPTAANDMAAKATAAALAQPAVRAAATTAAASALQQQAQQQFPDASPQQQQYMASAAAAAAPFAVTAAASAAQQQAQQQTQPQPQAQAQAQQPQAQGLASELSSRLSLRAASLSTSSTGSSRPAPALPPARPSFSRPAAPLPAPAVAAPAAAPAAAAAADARYAYDEVCARTVPGMDGSRLESYLTDAEFARILKMDRAAFAQLPKWKKDRLKKEADLF